MHDSIAKAIAICQEATTRIDELQTQLVILRKQCSGRDRPLCETLRLKGFADNQFVNTLLQVEHIWILVQKIRINNSFRFSSCKPTRPSTK